MVWPVQNCIQCSKCRLTTNIFSDIVLFSVLFLLHSQKLLTFDILLKLLLNIEYIFMGLSIITPRSHSQVVVISSKPILLYVNLGLTFPIYITLYLSPLKIYLQPYCTLDYYFFRVLVQFFVVNFHLQCPKYLQQTFSLY